MNKKLGLVILSLLLVLGVCVYSFFNESNLSLAESDYDRIAVDIFPRPALNHETGEIEEITIGSISSSESAVINNLIEILQSGEKVSYHKSGSIGRIQFFHSAGIEIVGFNPGQKKGFIELIHDGKRYSLRESRFLEFISDLGFDASVGEYLRTKY